MRAAPDKGKILMKISVLLATVSTTVCIGEVCAQSVTTPSASVSDDTLVSLNVEAVPLQSGAFGFISGFETDLETVFGKKVHLVDDREKHWHLVVRNATTGEGIDGLGWGSTKKPVPYSKNLSSDYTGGKTYPDARWDVSRPAIDPKTGKEFEPKVMTYGEAKNYLENAKSSMAIYTLYNDSNWMGAATGMDNGFYKSKHVVDNQAMMEWVAKNCQQWAREEFSKIDKPTLTEYLRERGDVAVNSDIETVNLEKIIGVPPPDNEEWRDVIKSFADLLETGEEIVEVRKDMREERHERKERERAERERKAAEEERLRQLQLAEQRKKSTAEQKKTDKKTSQTKPAKTSSTTTPKKSSEATTSIDFSKLNSLVSQQVSFVRGIISSGKKASSAQHSRFNSLNNQYVSEFNRLKAQIAKVSDSTKKSQYYSQLASINSRIHSELDPLLAQGQRRGLFNNL